MLRLGLRAPLVARNNRARGLYWKIPDWMMKLLLYGPSLWARSINQNFQPEVWNFTVKPEQTRLFSCLLYGSRQESERNRGSFHIVFIYRRNFLRIIKFRKEIFFRRHSLRNDTCFVQFLAFLKKFLSAKATKFAKFYKHKFWREKYVMPVGVYRGTLPTAN